MPDHINETEAKALARAARNAEIRERIKFALCIAIIAGGVWAGYLLGEWLSP